MMLVLVVAVSNALWFGLGWWVGWKLAQDADA